MVTAREQWAKDFQAVADKYFGGNLNAAQAALDALPYSPGLGWSDIDEVLVVLIDLGWRPPDARTS